MQILNISLSYLLKILLCFQFYALYKSIVFFFFFLNLLNVQFNILHSSPFSGILEFLYSVNGMYSIKKEGFFAYATELYLSQLKCTLEKFEFPSNEYTIYFCTHKLVISFCNW